MKSNLLRIFLEWALFTSVLMSVGFFVWFYLKSHSARAYETQFQTAQLHSQYSQRLANAIGNDCAAYARTNADMQRFLASLNQPAAAPAQAAPTKPATK